MSNHGHLTVFDEPLVQVHHGQRVQDPRAGLALFGPYGAGGPAHPAQLTHGVIASPEGYEAFSRFVEALNRPISVDGESSNRHLWRPFPGFDAAFRAEWPLTPAWSGFLDRSAVLRASRHADPHQRAFEVVNQYLESIRLAYRRDEHMGVLFCIVPEEVWLNCRPKSRVKNRIGRPPSSPERKLRTMGQQDMFGAYDPSQYRFSVDFRRQLKARAMEFGIPVQILRESTLRTAPRSDDARTLTPLADRAWNISTAAYYKAGGKPWRLGSAREGVCYIGLAFRRASDVERGSTACCAAQMFLDTGDGVVFKGEFGPWYSEEHQEYHLTREAAHDLLSGVLKTYRAFGGKPLKEVFLHSRSTILRSEFEGYRSACPAGTKLVAVRVRRERADGLKAFREGNWPVLRGTFLKATSRSGFLWGAGFVPALLSYPGWDVPRPLRIDIEHGEAEISDVAQDIFGLTKLNYNACRVGESQPVTVGFSDAVGEILVANPAASTAVPQFKFYI